MDYDFLTIDTRSPLHVKGYLASLAAGGLGAIQNLKGAWTTQFGPLNQFFFLQHADGSPILDGEPPIPPIPDAFPATSRKREILRVAMPFRPPTADIKIYEFRRYQIVPGMGGQFLDRLVAAMAIRTRYSPNYGIWQPAFGRTDRVFHLWAYPSLEERDATRARLKDDPEWATYAQDVAPMIEAQTNLIMVPLV